MEIPYKKFGLTFNLVTEDDVDFILELRTSERAANISKTSSDREAQVEWIKAYQFRESKGLEYYFVATNDHGKKLGLNRLYHIDADTFTLGSWLYRSDIHFSYAILGDLAAKDFGFNVLKLKECLFDVRKANRTVLKYHLKFLPVKLKEDELDIYFSLDYQNYSNQKNKLLSLLTHG